MPTRDRKRPTAEHPLPIATYTRQLLHRILSGRVFPKAHWAPCCFGVACALGVLPFSTLPAAQRPPNVIYINTDDWGIGKVPALFPDARGSSIIETPNLEQLKRDGMVFSEAYAGNAVCGPSRCSLISGRHPGHAAWRANRASMPKEVWPPSHPLLGEVARKAGYATAAYGKVSFGGTAKPAEITACGWDEWLGFLGHIDCRDYYADHIWENGRRIRLPKNTPELLEGTAMARMGQNYLDGTGTVGEGKGTFIEDLYTDRIIDFMKEHRERPFFVYFASTVPHGGPPGGMRVPALRPRYADHPDLTHREKIYCELLSRHDANVGRLRAALDELGLAKDTIVIWTSDNGDEDSYYRRTKTFDGNGPYRKMKRSLYEGGIRVPMIAAWPGTIEPGSRSDLVTAQWDLMPTLADAGGLPRADHMDGISILPTLRGEPGKQAARDHLYFEFYEGAKQQSVRLGKWKAYRKGGWQGTVEIYDLEEDPGETTDLAKQQPDLVRRMATIMEEEHEAHPVWNLGPR